MSTRNFENEDDRPWRDKDTLQELYHEKNMSLREVGDELGCDATTVKNNMEKLSLHRRSPTHTRDPVHYRQSDCGYKEWRHGDHRVYVHRLAAVAWFGLDEVIGKDVHHESNIPWDNREENLGTMTRSEHMALHRKEENQ